MWVLLITALAAMSALTVMQTPKEWHRRKITHILLVIGHVIGITSVALVLFGIYRLKDGLLREGIIWVETFYLTLAMYALVLTAVRYLAFEIARHFRHRKVLQILGNQTAFFSAVVLITVIYMIPAVHDATHVRTVSYNISMDKSCSEDSLSIALVSDFRVGAGARHSELDQMAEQIEEANADVVLIAGDICDSSSSVQDLEYLEKVLGELSARYGVYYAEGNHEKECRFDPDPYLTRAGVTILKDKGIRLENGVNIIGRKNALKESTARIMEECGLDSRNPTIVFQHRPKRLNQLDGVADLALCGHTHGYSFPFMGTLMPYLEDIAYGYRMYGRTNAIVSAGVAEWGFRTKWPSHSDISVVHVNFKEAS